MARTLRGKFRSARDFTLEQDGECKFSLAEVGEAIIRREPVDVDSLPTVLKYRGLALPDPLPRIFPFMSLLIVSPEFAEVIAQFDLGEGRVWPLRYEGLGKCSYFAVYVGEKKRTWCESVSTAKVLRHGNYVIDDLAAKSGEGSVVLSSSALKGADIWVEPLVATSLIFFSRQLASALLKLSIEDEFPLLECQIAE
ncbi:hypothetical protein RA27_19900 [Ruegeria sp. ANG-R]|uniref:hypothetical protein n=1 Tax=Ruegeria sp. ANG-R TaxID=1577903 RepID=UPI00057F535B|nr:hypothetical protein [Ruegeria sp. ANG-R]KIC38684.1 hypothetical protein RA27_19900 [Ruegeria sp. ANG-R]